MMAHDAYLFERRRTNDSTSCAQYTPHRAKAFVTIDLSPTSNYFVYKINKVPERSISRDANLQNSSTLLISYVRQTDLAQNIYRDKQLVASLKLSIVKLLLLLRRCRIFTSRKQ